MEPEKELIEVAKEVVKESSLAEIQRQAMTVQRESEDSKWAGISSYNLKEIPPLALAKLYASLPWGASGSYLTIPQCLVLAIYQAKTGLDPLVGDIFVLPSGKIGTSLQGMLKQAKSEGHKLGVARFEDKFREWPKALNNQPVKLIRKENRTDVPFSLDGEPGVCCTMEVNGQEVTYTAWLCSWYMPGNPNWYTRMDWMLRVSAQKRCLALGTGITVSEEITDTDAVSSTNSTDAPREVKAPKSIPVGRG